MSALDGWQDILKHFKIAKTAGDRCAAFCPAHNDVVPSLSIHALQDKLLVYCHAGCSFAQIVQAVGLKPSDFSRKQHRQYTNKATIETVYSYHDANKKLLYQVVRMIPKSFRIRRLVGDQWVWNLHGVRRVLYRLPQLCAQKKRNPVLPIWFTEGEKDAETLARNGLTATCIAGGASAFWEPHYTESLVGFMHVVFVPHADKPGRALAQRVAMELVGVIPYITILDLFPDRTDGADVSDLASVVSAPLYPLLYHALAKTPNQTTIRVGTL